MKPGIDQARLTAYALGELKGKEAADIEALAKQDPEVRRYIDEIRVFGKEMSFELNAEPAAATPPRTLWARVRSSAFIEISAAALILIFVAIPVSKRLPRLFTGLDSASDDAMSGSPSHEAAVHADNTEAARLIESVVNRPTAEVAAEDCRFQAPRLLRSDVKGDLGDSMLEGRTGKNLPLSYRLAGSSLHTLAILLGSVSGSFKPDEKDVLRREGNFQFVTHHTAINSSTVIGVANTAASYYCSVSVTLQGDLKGDALGDISAKIQGLAERIALSIAGQAPPP